MGRAVECDRALEEVAAYASAAAVGPVGQLGDRHAQRLGVAAALRHADLPGVICLYGVHVEDFDFDRGLRRRARHVGQVLHLQHDVFFERVLYLRVQVEHRQLQ